MILVLVEVYPHSDFVACSYRQPIIVESLHLFYHVVVVVDFILSWLLYRAYSTNLGLPYMLHPGMGPPSLTSLPKDGGVSCFGRSSGGRPSSF